jgi:carbamoyl-phosphate synthase large subunit
MKDNKKSILVFGGADFQLSLIKECLDMSLYTVVIDPNPNAIAQQYANAFEVVDGKDFEGTCKVVEKYKIDAIVTAATDKPLVMMAQIAKKYNFKFFSEETAKLCTDKFLMKQKFAELELPFAKGNIIKTANDKINFPIVIKPTDNSGSRGVIFCKNKNELENIFKESIQYTRKPYLLAEEFIDGKEYSIESLHFNGKSKIIQITEKTVSSLPYFVELGHVQPAVLDKEVYKKLEALLGKVTKAFGFENCGSHNEVKIKDGKITFIEISPRLGGDFISSKLVKASTGINMEKALLQIALGEKPNLSNSKDSVSGIFFFCFEPGIISKINDVKQILNIPEVIDYSFNLKVGDKISKITSSIDRYGYFILKTDNRDSLFDLKENILNQIKVNTDKI